MALTNTLFTGISGLDVNQTKLNVVGNNISNANTVGFKGSRALFKSQFYLTENTGSPPTQAFGGMNPNQRGLGATLSSIQRDWTAGNIEATGRQTDMAVDGNGLFIVEGEEQLFTRDGSFNIDKRNRLVTSDGLFVKGYGVDENGELNTSQLQNIEIPIGAMTIAKETETAHMSGNLNAAGDLSSSAGIIESGIELFSGGGAVTGATLLTNVEDAAATPLFAVGDEITLDGVRGGRIQEQISFTVDAGTTFADFQSFLEQGLGIVPGLAQASGGTSGASLKPGATTGTSLVLTANTGYENRVSIEGSALRNNGTPLFSFMSGTDALGNSNNPVGESVHTKITAYDSLGSPMDLDVTLNLVSSDSTGTTWRYIANSPNDVRYGSGADFDPASSGQFIGSGTVSFDNNGRLIDDGVARVLTVDRGATGADSLVDVELKFDEVSSLASTDSNIYGQQDGMPMGTLVGFGIGGTGEITGTFDNGLTSRLGAVALATFENTAGLMDQGGGLFAVGSNSGGPRLGLGMTGDAGTIRSGALELSNVDLSTEFVNMIIASTGFSAASRVITTSDQLMTELLNTAR